MEQKKNLHKEFVKVRADFMVGGKIVPLLIKTENDITCKIDKILDERDAPSLKAGGQGRRYTCRIGDKEIYLFHDRTNHKISSNFHKFFVEVLFALHMFSSMMICILNLLM